MAFQCVFISGLYVPSLTRRSDDDELFLPTPLPFLLFYKCSCFTHANFVKRSPLLVWMGERNWLHMWGTYFIINLRGTSGYCARNEEYGFYAQG